MKINQIKFRFVKTIPENIQNGILYISIPFWTAIHKCACGCGEKIVTPISPTDWSLTLYKDTVTLYPSIGNWTLPCKSHYFIIQNEIKWSRKWTSYEVRKGRLKDKELKEEYYKSEK